MKTQTITKKTISIVLVVLLFSANSAFAQKQNIEAEDISPMHSLLFWSAGLLFIICFIVLFILKLRDDNKYHAKQSTAPHIHSRHPNHYGRRHQFHR